MTADEPFWRFAWERQAVWHRRFVRGLPPPWTDDPVIRRYHLCNVHRELDRGTQVLLCGMREHAGSPRFEHVFNVLLYRYFNRTDVPWVRSRAEAEAVVDDRLARWERGEPVFPRTWVAIGGAGRRDAPSPLSHADRVRRAVRTWNPYALADAAAEATSLRVVLRAVRRQLLFGDVVGWQATLDLAYVFPHLSDDEWVPNVRKLASYDRGGRRTGWHGPGVVAATVVPGATFAEAVRRLRDSQDEGLAAANLRWADVAWARKPRLTLADVEHTLCELHKYRELCAGRVGGRRLYRYNGDRP